MMTQLRSFFILLSILLATGLLKAQMYVPSGSSMFISSGDTLYMNGDITLSSGSSNQINGIMQLTGSLTNNGSTTASSGTLVFNGTSAQAYNGGALAVGNFVASNTGGAITLNAPVTVNAASKFTNGLVVTTSSNQLIYANGASVGTPTDASHVNGPAGYLGTGSFTFPVGNATYYRPVAVNLASNSAGFTATYTLLNGTLPPGAGSYTAPLQTVSKQEYWDLSPSGSASGTVTLNWDAGKVAPGILNQSGVAALQVAHYTGGTWISEGGTASGTYNATGTITSSNTISAWSPFALGSTDVTTAPLPIKFLGISASLNSDGSRLVQWQVAQEVNVKDYVVQRSMDGVNFVDAGTVAATGSADQQTYTYTDAADVNGNIIYYRIKEIDQDDQPVFSSIAIVNLQNDKDIQLQPNPVIAYTNMTAVFGKNMRGSYRIDLISIDGRIIYSQYVTVSDYQGITVNRPARVAKATYVVRFTRSSDGYTKNFKVVFQ